MFDYSNVCDERLVLQLKDDIDVLKRENEELSSDATRSRIAPQTDNGCILGRVTRVCLVVCASMSPLLALQAVRMGKQFAQLVGHTNHRQKIQYVQKLTNENLSLKKVCTLHHLFLSTHSHLPSVRACVRACVYTLHGVSKHVHHCLCVCMCRWCI